MAGKKEIKARAGRGQRQDENEKGQGALSAGLYLVATPIGHAQDISLRALDVLDEADVIYCEDTRVSQKLFHMHGISFSRLKAAHAHNEEQAATAIVADIKKGMSVAYVSDAGLPLISDPGHVIVEKVLAEELPLTSIPGANAALTALQLSGLPAQPFYFVGFLPPKEKARGDALEALAKIPATLVFYEAPHRFAESLSSMAEALGNRRAAYARELTKLHEEVVRGHLPELAKSLSGKADVKGEIVVVVAPPEEEVLDEKDIDAQLKAALKTLSPRDAAFDVAARTGLSKRALYQRILGLQKKEK